MKNIILFLFGFLLFFYASKNVNFSYLHSDKIVSQVSIPKRLNIPSIGVNAYVESQGRGEDGEMKVPMDENNLSWWNEGAHPGEMGSVVIAGHLDRKDGGPGVFYNIAKLKPGDAIEIEDLTGKKFEYRVYGIEEYDDASFPINKVFLDSTEKKLNLITCAGVFNRAEKNYSKRLVVYAEM